MYHWKQGNRHYDQSDNGTQVMRAWATALVLAILMLGLSSAHSQEISLSQTISDTEIRFEDSLYFEITLTWKGSQGAYRFERPLRPTIDRLKVRGYTSSVATSTDQEAEITTKRFQFVLAPTSSGIGRIDPVHVEFVSWPDSIPGELVTEPISVSIANPVPVARDEEGSYLIWLLIGAGIVLLGGATVWGIKRKKPAEPPPKPPEEVFLDRLGQLKAEAGADLKTFQTGLHKMLLEYIRVAHNMDLADDSDEVVRERLTESDFGEEQVDAISGWLVRAHRDRFSPVKSSPGEVIRLESEIRSFFEKKMTRR